MSELGVALSAVILILGLPVIGAVVTAVILRIKRGNKEGA